MTLKFRDMKNVISEKKSIEKRKSKKFVFEHEK